MKAMVLCAGYGTRLGELTASTPKPMLQLGDRPLIGHIIGNLAAHGFDQIAINLHFRPEVVTSYLGDGSRFAVELTYSYEHELLGTAGGVGKMADFLRGAQPFLVHYGDVITDQDLSAMLRFHQQHDAQATLLMHQRPGSNSIVRLDDQRRVIDFRERPSPAQRQGITSPWVNSGICLCSSIVLDTLPAQLPADLPRDVFPALVAGGRFFGFALTGYRCAVDSSQRLTEVRNALAEGRYRPLHRTFAR